MIKKLGLFVFVLSFATLAAIADEPPPFDNIDDEGDPIPAGIPVDGGASLLLAAGVAYGIKRASKKKQAPSEEVPA